MNTIKTWLNEHNVSSHTIAAVLIGAATLYTTDPTVSNLVNTALAKHPEVLVWVTTAVGIILKYSGSHNTQGQVALIANTPSQKVAAAVAAVKESEVKTPPPAAPNMQNVAVAAAAKPATPKA